MVYTFSDMLLANFWKENIILMKNQREIMS